MPMALEFAIRIHPTREEIELRAHQIYAERGGADGRDVEDWLQAERELLDEKYGKTGRMAKAVSSGDWHVSEIADKSDAWLRDFVKQLGARKI
jgi:hypothetical protein